jgi:hypothetical protein
VKCHYAVLMLTGTTATPLEPTAAATGKRFTAIVSSCVGLFLLACLFVTALVCIALCARKRTRPTPADTEPLYETLGDEAASELDRIPYFAHHLGPLPDVTTDNGAYGLRTTGETQESPTTTVDNSEYLPPDVSIAVAVNSAYSSSEGDILIATTANHAYNSNGVDDKTGIATMANLAYTYTSVENETPHRHDY